VNSIVKTKLTEPPRHHKVSQQNSKCFGQNIQPHFFLSCWFFRPYHLLARGLSARAQASSLEHTSASLLIYYIFSKNKFISPHHNKLLLLNMIAADDGRNASKWIMLFMMIISLSLLRFCWAISHHQQCSPLQCNSHLSESHRDLQKRTLLLCKWHVCSW